MGSGRSDRAWARGARRCVSSIDHVWCADIGQVLAPAPPNRIAQTARTSSMAARAVLDRRPASSLMYIFPYTIVTVALSLLAGSSPLAPVHAWWASGDRAGWGRPIARGTRRCVRKFCRIDHALHRYRCSSRAGPCAVASEPDREDPSNDRINGGLQVAVADTDAGHLIRHYCRRARSATLARHTRRHAAQRWQHSNGRDCLD